MDARDIKQRLVDQIESFCTHLYPNGNKQNGNWLIGDIYGSDGKSFAICLKDNKYKGLGKDFNGGDAKDVFHMWQAVKGCSFKEAVSQIHQYLGIVEEIERPIPLRKPKPFGRQHLIDAKKCPVQKYLEDRGIRPDTQRKYKVAACNRDQSEWNDHFIAYQHETPEGEKLLLKYKGVKRKPNGKQETGVLKVDNNDSLWSCLFGWWLVNDETREIVITEGHEDSMACCQMVEDDSIPVLSLPMGTSNLDWIDRDWNRLQQFERINLWCDNDKDDEENKGQICAKKIAQRLGVHRCFNIVTDYNDANQLLLEGDEHETVWHNIYSKAKQFNLKEIVSHKEGISGVVQAMKNRFDPSKNTFVHPEVPVRFEMGKTSVISGYPNSGKSAWSYFALINEMKHGSIVLICSLEIPIDEMKLILTKIVLGRDAENENDIMVAAEWLDGRVFYYDPSENPNWKTILGHFDYGVKRHGINHTYVDSLHFLVDKKDTEAQDEVMKSYTRFNKKFSVHGTMVVHSYKADLTEIPGMREVEGSNGVTKVPDLGLTIWRNIVKEKPEEYDSGERTGARTKRLLEGPDAILSVWKVRGRPERPNVDLWFDFESETFRTDRQPRWTPIVSTENDF